MTIPRHVTAHINTRTGLDITEKSGRDNASRARCPQCRAPVWVGLDAEVAGMPATIDPRLLTRSDELAALLAGRATYLLHPVGPKIRRRDHWAITGHPADTVPTVAAHACGSPLGQPIAPTAARTADTDGVQPCPF